jgi:hypothetical protein
LSTVALALAGNGAVERAEPAGLAAAGLAGLLGSLSFLVNLEKTTVLDSTEKGGTPDDG